MHHPQVKAVAHSAVAFFVGSDLLIVGRGKSSGLIIISTTNIDINLSVDFKIYSQTLQSAISSIALVAPKIEEFFDKINSHNHF